jgi:exodeoxyribonuclease I
LFFYDTETTGTDTAFDQILQFAAIRTDENLREVEQFEIRCRMLPHVVPSAGALIATGVTPRMLTDNTLPTHYEAARQIAGRLADWSPSIFLGYNSTSFDEELLRQTFYQTPQPIYVGVETATAGQKNSRRRECGYGTSSSANTSVAHCVKHSATRRCTVTFQRTSDTVDRPR